MWSEAPCCGYWHCCNATIWCHKCFVCVHMHIKKKSCWWCFFVTFLAKTNLIISRFPLAPLPSLGAFSVMQGVGCWTNPVRRNTPSSGNHRHGCTTSWQEERNDQQKNINRWWKAAWISCLNKQSEERGTTVWRGVCLCVHCVCVCMSVTVWAALCNHCQTGPASCVAFLILDVMLRIKIPLLFPMRNLLTHSAAH